MLTPSTSSDKVLGKNEVRILLQFIILKIRKRKYFVYSLLNVLQKE